MLQLAVTEPVTTAVMELYSAGSFVPKAVNLYLQLWGDSIEIRKLSESDF